MIEAVRTGQADIGFVAYEATRLGTVEFSQTYMLVQQTFLVLDGSPIKAVADIDRSASEDRRHAQPIRSRSVSSACSSRRRWSSSTTIPNMVAKAIAGREIDALGANRQRLTT